MAQLAQIKALQGDNQTLKDVLSKVMGYRGEEVSLPEEVFTEIRAILMELGGGTDDQ